MIVAVVVVGALLGALAWGGRCAREDARADAWERLEAAQWHD